MGGREGQDGESVEGDERSEDDHGGDLQESFVGREITSGQHDGGTLRLGGECLQCHVHATKREEKNVGDPSGVKGELLRHSPQYTHATNREQY